jgi:hypothetical protein
MKKLLLGLLLGVGLLLCPTAKAASPSFVGGCTPTAGTSCTLPAHQNQDLEVDFAYRSGSTTHPTLPTSGGGGGGYTAVDCGTGANGNSHCMAYRFLNGTETTTGTFTNATDLLVYVYRGANIGTTGFFGGHATGSGASTTIAYNTITLSSPGGSGTSWVLGFACGASATNVDVAPGAMTLRSGTTLTNCAASDTAGGVSSWATTNVTVSPTGDWRSEVVELQASPATSGISNYLVRHFFAGVSGEPCTGACNFTLPFPGSSGANNHLKLALIWGYASVSPTISNIYCNADTGHATWTWTDFGHLVNDTSDTINADIYDIFGAAAGCTSVTVVFSSVFGSISADYTEWRQVATSSGMDTGAGQNDAGALPNITAGAITTTSSGDIIYQFCSYAVPPADIGFTTSTGIYAGDSAFLLASSISFAYGSEAFVQTTAGAITPYMQLQGSAAGNDGICVEEAMKTSGGAGTAPTGAQIISESTETFGPTATFNVQASVINAGDTIVVAGNTGVAGSTNQNWTGISDALSNTWTTKQNAGGTAGVPAFSFDSNDTAGNDYIHFTGGSTDGNGTVTIIEMSGLQNSSHTASYDATMGLCSNTGGAAPYSSAPGPCTPSTTNGIVLATMTDGTGPVTAITSPSGGVYAYPVYTGMTDISFMTEGGGYSYIYNSTTSALSWTWTNANSSAWAGSALAFIAQPAGAFTPDELYWGFAKGVFDDWTVSVWGLGFGLALAVFIIWGINVPKKLYMGLRRDRNRKLGGPVPPAQAERRRELGVAGTDRLDEGKNKPVPKQPL